MGPGPKRNRITRALAEALEPIPQPDNVDVEALAGASPWLRMRVGDYRIIYRPLTAEELTAIKESRGEVEAGQGFLVQRVVHRGELERAVTQLPEGDPS